MKAVERNYKVQAKINLFSINAMDIICTSARFLASLGRLLSFPLLIHHFIYFIQNFYFSPWNQLKGKLQNRAYVYFPVIKLVRINDIQAHSNEIHSQTRHIRVAVKSYLTYRFPAFVLDRLKKLKMIRCKIFKFFQCFYFISFHNFKY
ncbi:hypothetical protein SAMN05444146_5152 [Flavobacterium johnsoniae]|nr:hypothetical protein SAMN05444146_5152 [Flavobacterium johnsoniae]